MKNIDVIAIFFIIGVYIKLFLTILIVFYIDLYIYSLILVLFHHKSAVNVLFI